MLHLWPRRAHAEFVDQPCTIEVTGLVGKPGESFSVGNLYLATTYYKRRLEYQPKAQACFFIRNDKLEAGKACMQH